MKLSLFDCSEDEYTLYENKQPEFLNVDKMEGVTIQRQSCTWFPFTYVSNHRSR